MNEMTKYIEHELKYRIKNVVRINFEFDLYKEKSALEIAEELQQRCAKELILASIPENKDSLLKALNENKNFGEIKGQYLCNHQDVWSIISNSLYEYLWDKFFEMAIFIVYCIAKELKIELRRD